ncbi:SGNH/GDSL hydrolase family protein [Dyadobacter psychrotolerans]|uniref:SGNH/GDSL hydrolase family protein n=1 Tax=Dyadobacter psychrotolerans TaxID=2541721 RepID=A0A4R5DMD8_9BACT|nr:SGNH/GDSL hydrolase family protein [Dyadobacter psychrotolerans]TDE15299.1 SGNH/GDSL hydrolase family protein [Dyadobacter psychrotolerans]
MKNLFKFLIPLLFAVSAFGQSGFPVKVDQTYYNGIKDSFNASKILKDGGLVRSNPVNITMKDICETEGMPWTYVTRLRGTAITSVGQDLALVNFSFGSTYNISPPFFPYISSLRVKSNRKIDISIRVDNIANNIFKGPNDNLAPNGYSRINAPYPLVPNQYFEIEHEFLKIGWMSTVTFVVAGYDATDTTPLDLDIVFVGHSITKQLDRNADFVFRFDGDSITNGTGAGYFENDRNTEHFSLQINRHLKSRGYRSRPVNKGQGSMTTDGMVQAIKWGYYDIQRADLICIMIGANDANNLGSGGMSTPANRVIFENNMRFIINYNRAMYPNAKIMIFGSTPSADNTTEARIELGRQIQASIVASINSPNLKYESLANAFDRTNTANYLASDTIHPTAQKAISDAMIAAINATGWFPSKI